MLDCQNPPGNRSTCCGGVPIWRVMAYQGPSGPYVFDDHARARGIVVVLAARGRVEMESRRNRFAIDITDSCGTSTKYCKDQ